MKNLKIKTKIIVGVVGVAVISVVTIAAGKGLETMLTDSVLKNLELKYKNSVETTIIQKDLLNKQTELLNKAKLAECLDHQALKAYKVSAGLQLDNPEYDACAKFKLFNQKEETTKTEEMPKHKQFNVDVTSYNPEVGQTDSSPCIAAGGHDICKMARQGIKTIAISRDLREEFLPKQGPYFKYGETQVFLESDNPSIHGCYIIADTMNARFTKRIDIFNLNRGDNIGLEKAVISNKTEYCN